MKKINLLLLLMTSVAMPAEDSRQVTKLEEESSVLPLRLWRVGFWGRDGVDSHSLNGENYESVSTRYVGLLGHVGSVLLNASMFRVSCNWANR